MAKKVSLRWMRVRLILAIALCVSALRAASPSAAAPVFNVFRKADTSFGHFVELQRTSVTQELDLVIAMGSREALPAENTPFWSEDRKIGLFLQEKSHPERVDLLATKAGFPDCYARVERVTSTDTVISCRGEKSATYPNQKWVYDIRARKLIRQFSYQPFAMKQILPRGSGAVFVGTDQQRLIAVQYEPNHEPAFRVLPEVPSPHQIDVDETPPPAGVSSFSRTTYDQFAAARPQRVKNGYRREGTQILESVGPWQRDGERIWFGKTFYDGEGETGVGGFGYFDQTAKQLRLFAPPEIADWSVSALDVTADAVWLALVNNGEYGGSSGGLLRYDRESGAIRRFPLPDIAFRLNHASGKILAATEFGFAVVTGDQVTRYFVDQTVEGNWRVVPATR